MAISFSRRERAGHAHRARISKFDAVERYWPRAITLPREFGHLIVIGWFIFHFASAATYAQTPNNDTQSSLATCRLQTIASSGKPASMVADRRRRTTAKPLADYQRDRGIDWRVAKNINANDPRIRCLLICPGGPYIVDLQVLIDGQPFRMKREQAIDQAEAGRKLEEELTKSSDQGPKEDSETESKTDEVNEPSDADGDLKETEESEDETAETSSVTSSVTHSPSVARLIRHMQRQSEPVDRNAARWLLAQWTPGPALLMLRDGFAAERATIAPVWHVLDRDQDGDLSTEEFSLAQERLISADVNGDEAVDMSELRRLRRSSQASGKAKSKLRAQTPRRLLVTLDEHTEWNALFSDVTEFYSSSGALPSPGELAVGKCDASSDLIGRLDANGNQVWDQDETSQLQSISPDMTLQIRLGTSGDSKNGVTVQQLSSVLGSADEILRASAEAIAVELGQCYLELAAAQPSRETAGKTREDAGGAASDQVAIGAVMDGYPIMRLLDQNNDGRLSIRECKSVSDILATHDRNQDGQLALRELSLPVRFSVTLGPHVDTMLRSPAPPVLLPTSGTGTAVPKAPPWFTTMDSNKDGDLSRREFLGTRAQFKRLDADNDGLLSAKEASQFDPAKE